MHNSLKGGLSKRMPIFSQHCCVRGDKFLMELICWAKSEIAVASATTTIMYLATTIPTTHPLDEASGIIARQCGSGTISKHK